MIAFAVRAAASFCFALALLFFSVAAYLVIVHPETPLLVSDWRTWCSMAMAWAALHLLIWSDE